MNRFSSTYGSLWAPVLLCLVPQAVYLTQGFSPALDGGLIGPELLYRTSHRVVATPYHRSGAGILAVHGLM